MTNSLGATSTYTWQRNHDTGQSWLLFADGAGCITCPPTSRDYSYTSDKQSVEQKDANGETTRYDYDEWSRLFESRSTTPGSEERLNQRRRYREMGHVTFGQPVEVIRPSVFSGRKYQVTTEHDPEGLPTAVIERGYSPILDDSGELTYEPIANQCHSQTANISKRRLRSARWLMSFSSAERLKR